MQNEHSLRSGVGRRATVARRHSAAAVSAALAASLALAASAPQTDLRSPAQLRSVSPTAVDRLREGTRIADRLGTFTIIAKQPVFRTSDGKLQFGGLPNLNLERVVRTLQDSEAGLIWSVSGIVTEYHGGNFLLITRAVLKSTESTRASRLGQPPGDDDHPREGPSPGQKRATPPTVPPAGRSAAWGAVPTQAGRMTRVGRNRHPADHGGIRDRRHDAFTN